MGRYVHQGSVLLLDKSGLGLCQESGMRTLATREESILARVELVSSI